MATSVFFKSNFEAYNAEQELLTNLIVEAIKIYGEDVWYVPRDLNNYDEIYGADDQSSYTRAHLIEMYIKSVDGFQGDGNFMSKFGVEIRDQVTFSVAQRTFDTEVGTIENIPRPREGDLIYFPLNRKLFQIKFVNKFEMMYPLGKLHTWDITCELFEYASEHISTGIEDIDRLAVNYNINAVEWAITDENGFPILTESGGFLVQEGHNPEDVLPGDDAEELQAESDAFIDFTETDPFSAGNI